VNINDKPGGDNQWQENTPSELTTTVEPSGWGDQETPANAESRDWDAVNQATTENAPSGFVNYAPENKNKPKEREPQKKFKSYEEYLLEQQEKSKELATLLAQFSITTPVPRNIVEDESGGRYVDKERKLEPTTTKKKEEKDKKKEKEKEEKEEKEKPKKVSEPISLPVQIRYSLFKLIPDPR
jgi:hypothetical protein